MASIDAFYALSDHITNNNEDYYKIPNSKLRDICGIYNKDKAILLTWDDKHNSFDINSINIDIDDITKIRLQRILKISKINNIKI